MRDAFDFRWPVYREQYQWVDAIYSKPSESTDPRDSGRQIVEFSDVMARVLTYPLSDANVREYAPLRSEPTLFLTFAQVELSEAGILAFANQFGGLGVGQDSHLTPILPSGERARLKSPVFSRGRIVFRQPAERFEIWEDHLFAMRSTVQLWEILRRGDNAEIARHIVWREDKTGRCSVIYHIDPSIPAPVTGLDENFTHIGMFAPGWNPLGLRFGELFRPARLWIAGRINEYLQGEVSPHLDQSDRDARPAISFAPRSLIGALWLQFALAVAGNADFRACKGCGRLFEVSRMASRSDRLFCSTACRVKAYRDRQGRAREMFAQGKSVKEIAAALVAKADAVRGWVKGVRRGE